MTRKDSGLAHLDWHNGKFHRKLSSISAHPRQLNPLSKNQPLAGREVALHSLAVPTTQRGRYDKVVQPLADGFPGPEAEHRF